MRSQLLRQRRTPKSSWRNLHCTKMLGLPDLLARRKGSLLKSLSSLQAELTQLDSDSFKPEEVLQEVRGLLEQQRVTEFLQNEIERQHLEQ